MDDIADVPIRGEMIRLGQFLKFTAFAESGADAARLIAEGRVSVNGSSEGRRGRQLHRADVVELHTDMSVLRARVC